MTFDLVTLFAYARKGVVLTVNNRLAASLVDQFDQFHMAAGDEAWVKPNILPLSVWLGIQASQLGLAPVLLTEQQNLRLWEEIVEQGMKQEQGLQLLQTAATAKKVRDAHNLLLQYGGDPGRFSATDESRIFFSWLKEWKQRTSKRGLIVSASLATRISEAFASHPLAIPSSLALVGFDLIPPDLQRLMESLARAGCDVVYWQGERSSTAQPQIHQATDPHEEMRHCARWARGLLLKDPTLRIGIVAPRLAEYRSGLASALQAELSPGESLQPDAIHPVNFSLGSPLAQEGPVKLALSLLSLGYRVELALAGWLLRSPYLGGAGKEMSARALADRDLRRKGQSVIGLSRLITILRKQGSIPKFLDSLERLQAWSQEKGHKRPGVWAEKFTRLLEAVGWPGDRPLVSRDYKAIDKFTELLTRIASLDRVSAPVSREAAIGMLNRMAQEEEFQTEDQESCVQVLGLLESAGQSFDALWILGMHDTALPSTPQPNPFLPLALQKEQNMPHADADRELEFAEKVCQRLFSAAPSVVVSWPESIEGAECRPSPLLAGLPSGTPELAPPTDPRQVLGQLSPLECLNDSHGPALPPGRTFNGGTGILKDQALCPFRAFAHHRLRGQGLDVPEIGLDPMSRGTLVHGLLEHFWRDVRSLEALLAMDEGPLTEKLEQSAEFALSSFEKEQKLDLQPRQRQIEQVRLMRVGRTWLEKERERSPFVVTGIEKNQQIRLGPLSIRTRIDRIDQLSDGRQVVIDYKTGQPDTGQWYDSRVTEPQLPAYCLSMPEDQVGGALFARVNCRQRDSRFYGILHPDSCWTDAWQKNLDNILQEKGWADFKDLLEHWKMTLNELSEEFINGEARVDPVDLEKACKYCDILPLCRRLEKDELRGTGHE